MIKKTTLFLLLLSLSAFAQIDVNIKPTRSQFVAFESVGAVLTLTNRTGTDVILQGTGLNNWLKINIYDKNRNLLPYVGGTPAYKGVRIPAGQSVQKKISLSSYYDLTRYGVYNFTASVKLPGRSNQEVRTTSQQFTITDAIVLARQKIGTPGTKTARTYEVMRLNGLQKAYMYIKITNDLNNRVLVCRPISQVIPTKPAKIAVDSKNMLHLLYLITNSTYVHVIIDATGTTTKSSYHKKGTYSEPRLVTFANGEIKVAGTVPYDPVAERKKAEESRKLSDRPDFR